MLQQVAALFSGARGAPTAPPGSPPLSDAAMRVAHVVDAVLSSPLAIAAAATAVVLSTLTASAALSRRWDPELYLSKNTLARYAPDAAHRRKKLVQLQRPSALSLPLADLDRPNPFVSSRFGERPSAYNRAKVAVLRVTLMPLRIVCSVLLFSAAWLLSTIALVGAPSTDRLAVRPLPRWRRVVVTPVRWLMRGILFCFGFHHITVRGRPRRARVIVCNHVSFVECLFMASWSEVSFVAAAEYAHMPWLRALSRAYHVIAVDRKSPTSRSDVASAIRERCKSKYPWPPVCLFPEGTTTNGRALIQFKLGAFTPGVPVQPVVVRYPHRHFDPSWTEAGPTLGGLCTGLLCQVANYMEVTFLPVYTPSADEVADARLYATNVRKLMATALGVPVTGHTLDDVALQREAALLRLPADAAVVDMSRITELFQVDRDSVKTVMAKFARMDNERRGKLSMDQWVAAVCAGDEARGSATGGSPAQDEERQQLEKVFKLLDIEEKGTLDFREYLLGVLLMNSAGKDARRTEDALRFCWEVLAGSTGEGLGKEQLRRLLCLPGNEQELSETPAMELFDSMDTDHDGKIDFEDFRALTSKHPDVLQAFTQRMVSRDLGKPVQDTAALPS